MARARVSRDASSPEVKRFDRSKLVDLSQSDTLILRRRMTGFGNVGLVGQSRARVSSDAPSSEVKGFDH